MKLTKNLAAVLTLLLLFSGVSAQHISKSFAVQANAVVKSNPSHLEITLEQHWGTATIDSIEVYRRTPDQTSWGNPMLTITNVYNQTVIIDSNIVEGQAYEYQFLKYFGSSIGMGYMQAGAKIPAVEYRGVMLLLIDSTKLSSCAAKLLAFERNLIGDGWQVKRIYAQPTDGVRVVKQKIITQYNLDKTNTKALMIFGNIPVPYSGVFDGRNLIGAPDGHSPDHDGAWATDLYYGDMDENLWTDNEVLTYGKIDRNENKNKKNDDKFDQMILPSAVELAVGRVDFSNLPAFSKTETELLNQYLQKNHDYRHGVTTVSKEAIIDDHFGVAGGEAFAAMGWWSFPSMYSFSKVTAADYSTSLLVKNIQWAYACGPGSYTNCLGVANGFDFAVANSKAAVFNAVLGSYFGDFDSENNFMRSILAASNNGLISFWGGRPYWHLHKMALGGTIGEQALMSQNNDGSYRKIGYDNQIHMNLMGDPTLRQDIISPVSNIAVQRVNSGTDVQVTWTASTDQVIGYHVYRANDFDSKFTRITTSLITGSSFTDNSPNANGSVYMVRALKLETTGSGTYYNLSQGMFAEDITSQSAQILTSIKDNNNENPIIMSVYPNPTTDGVINITFSADGEWDVYVTDVTGKAVTTVSHISTRTTSFNLSNMAKGLYFVKAQKGTEQYVKKVVVQ